MRKGLEYGAGLVGLYLLVVYFHGSSSVLSTGGGALSNVVAAFQGRAANTSTPIP